jgi:acetylornithine deacetylase/succinyl-diaminopimelate desuccinylase
MKIEEVFESVDEDMLLSITKDLIQIPSHSGTPGQEREISRFVEGLFQGWGLDVMLQEVQDGRSNVLAKIGGSRGGKNLALNGHLDTVPPGRDMTDPYRTVIQEGRLFGRGSADMKGAVAAMIYTLHLLKSCQMRLMGDLHFTGVVGEESGGTGTRFLTKSGFKPDCAVVGEPTNLDLVTSHKGVEQLEVRIRGRAAHGSMPDRGVNAISAASEFIQRLEKELIPQFQTRSQEQVGTATLNVGVIQGGDKVNMVADFCSVQIDRRWVKTEELGQVVSEIEDAVREVCKKDPGLKAEVVSLHPRDGYFGPFAISKDHELITRAKEALKLADVPPRISGMQGWTDAATLMHAGIPAVLLGPGDVAQAHTTGEYLEISQLVTATKCYLALTKTICGWK